MRRVAATLAAGLLAGAGLLSTAPAQAQAQTNIFELARLLNSGIATADCGAVSAGLAATGLTGPQTTRGELVAGLSKLVGDDSAVRLVAAPTINALGDRALECGAVKADPVTPASQAIALSSQLSSQAGLPELRNLLPALQL